MFLYFILAIILINAIILFSVFFIGKNSNFVAIVFAKNK